MSQDDPENQAITENQPADQQSNPALERSQSVEIVSTTISWRGPLPPPAVLRQYDDVLPGSAERIMRTMEERANHRIQAEKAAVEAASKRAYLGLATGFIISLLMIAAGAYAIIWGNNPWLGVAVIAAQNLAFASLFVYVANARRRARERKAADADAERDW